MGTVDLTYFVPSGNHTVDPELYDIENGAIDRSGLLWEELKAQEPWQGRVLLDLGCGSGFSCRSIKTRPRSSGSQPRYLARHRPGRAQVLHGSAEHIPLPDGSVDVVHARFAYFFTYRDFDPTPGLVEVGHVVRPGGKLVVIDNDTEEGEFAELLQASPLGGHPGPGHVRA